MKRLVLALVVLLAAGCQKPNWNPDPPWDHAPVTVDWSADLDDAMPWAMDSWNHAAGCRVLVRAHGTPDVTVGPYDGTACGRDANLEATGDAVAGAWRCSPTHAEVRFKVLSDIRSNGIAATHEMGHVLGLAHDRSALMQAAPELYHPERLAGNDGPLPWPSDADGAAVGKRYCR